MSNWKPYGTLRTAYKLLIPSFTTVNGMRKVSSWTDAGVIFACVKSFGGTEMQVNGVWASQDTATVQTHYRNDITGECRLKLVDDASEWEIITTPEDIDMAHRWLQFKIRRYTGKV